ncbi:AAA family ATPase [Niameybacter massiliensis]|uniref:AAA family ATPase n=1 Tax=Niameybacter massiliensis TaxID=1658108 RepID=UPI0006B5710F|nr:AAA family ATPase [Niameybacter massiliensis]
MKLLLKVLELKNFKGIKERRIFFDTTETRIYGANGTGKTTIADAFSWLLYDKDSQERKDFEIKPLTEHNEPIHFLNTEVTADFVLNGKTFTLGKLFREKWVKKRGQAEQEFSGHETIYYIDGVPCKKSEYQEYVNEIINEKTFKLLTNPLAFEAMKWQDKRKFLFEVCGNIADNQIEGYEKLQETLAGKSADEYKKSLAATKKKLKSDIENIPPRIDEQTRSLEEGLEPLEVLQAKIDEKEAYKAELEKQLEATDAQFNEIRTKQHQILSLERTKEEIIRAHNKSTYAEYNQNKDRLETLKRELSNHTYEQDSIVKKIEALKQDEVILTSKVADRRNEWMKIEEETFDEHKAICPTCGQDLPSEEVEKLKSKYIEEKAIRQERLLNEANIIKADLLNTQQNMQNLTTRFEEIACQLVSIQSNINEVEKILEKPIDTTPCDTSEIDNQIDVLKKEVQAFESVDNEAIKQAIKMEEINIQNIKLRVSKHDSNAKALARIKELQEQLKDLQCKLADVEQVEIMIEDFTKAKVEMLEANINSKFKNVSFKLFDQQINGGLAECCESLINGVPFSNANNAAQVQAGIEIINVLSEHYGMNAPIFIDNRESVTDIPATQSQVIDLIVSAVDKELRIE